MKRLFLLLFLFLHIPLVAMDLEKEQLKNNRVNVQQEGQELHALWGQIKVRLHRAVQAKNLNIIVHIFDQCFKKGSLLVEHKSDAYKIVMPFAREALEEEYIVGLRSEHEVQHIIKLVGLYKNKEYLKHLEGVHAGVRWLRTGKVSRNLDTEKIVVDWNRIVRECLKRAFAQRDLDTIQKIWRVNYSYNNPEIQPHLLQLSNFILSNWPSNQALQADTMHVSTESTSGHQDVPLVNTPDRTDELLALETEPEVVQDDVAQETIVPDQPRVERVATVVHNEQRTGVINWIQKHPIISLTGIATLCGGVYAYFKKEKAEQPKTKIKKINKQGTA